MKKINITFSEYSFKVKKINGKPFIFDVVRKKFVALTPEEKVRQLMLHFLIHDLNFPKSLTAVEMNIMLNQMQKRCDIVVFEKSGSPFLIVECKSPKIKITQNVFDQIARYNLALKVKYLIVTNGEQHFVCEMNYTENTYCFLEDMDELSFRI